MGATLRESLAACGEQLRAYCDTPAPERGGESFPLEQLSVFERLCVLRCLRPDRLVPAVSDLVSEHLGTYLVEQLKGSVAVLCRVCFLLPKLGL